jgi:hypothetical protein
VLARLHREGAGTEHHGRLQAVSDTDGGKAAAIKGKHHGEGGRDALPEHHRRVALTHIRLDISFTVMYVSRFMEDPREDHWVAVKHLLRYIKGTTSVIFPRPVEQGCS